MPVQKETIGKSIKIPKVLMEKFQKEMRITHPGELVGLWPIDPGMLKDQVFINELLKDKTFLNNYEIAIVAKSGK